MSLLQRINTIISVVLLVVCAIAFGVFGWSASGWKALGIPTESMRPDIPSGSLVLVHRVPVSSLKVGDVITHIDAANPKITLTHRIIKEYMLDGRVEAFVTKGDANKIADKPIVSGQVIGKVVWHAPDIGWAIVRAKNPWITLPIVYIAGLLIMLEELQRLKEYFKLSVPYRAPGFAGHDKESSVVGKRLSQGVALTAAFVVVGISVGPSALAALRTNTVTLADNKFTTLVKTPSTTCKGNNKNTTTINTTTTQTGSSGNVFVSGNKGNTGNVSSGSVSNNTTTITVNQGC